MKILIVEDNADIASMTGEYLAQLGHAVDYASNGERGLALAREGDFDVIVLDRVLPRLDGATLCRRLREQHGCATPVLMLTALDRLEDKVTGLGAGADDYLIKPFELAELHARLQALHRRASHRVARRVLKVADLEFDPDSLEARRAGRPIELNPASRKVLEHLMRHSERVVTRAELEELLWGADVPDQDFLRAHIHKLRESIDRDFDVKLLNTYRGHGYRLCEPG